MVEKLEVDTIEDTSIRVDKNSDERITQEEAANQVSVVKRYCITQSQGLGHIATFSKHVVLTPKDRMFNTIAYTNGYQVCYGEGFFMESLKAQAAVVIHELLHVGLRHPQRGKKLLQTKNRPFCGDEYNPSIFNLAVDCIVNLGLNRLVEEDKVEWPDVGCIQFNTFFNEEELKEFPPHRWSAENLYFRLMKKANDESDEFGFGQLSSLSDAVKEALEDIINGKGNNKSVLSDVHADMENTEEDTSEEERNWHSRMERASAGDKAGGALRSIVGDLNKTDTPWQSFLRKYITACVLPETELHDYKPSRGMMSRTYVKKKKGGRVPWESGVQRKKGIKRMAIIVDTSGSIGDKQLLEFLRQVHTIRSQTGAIIVLLFADTCVQKIMEIGPWDNLKETVMKEKETLGGGGTDFRPAVEAVEKMPEIHIAVYLTDMMGPFPEKCKVPLLWASTYHNHRTPPVGRVVYIAEND